MDVFSFSSPDIKTNDATNNITDYVKLCKKRRESSKRNSYIISSKMMMKAIIIIGFLARSRSVKSAILLAAFTLIIQMFHAGPLSNLYVVARGTISLLPELVGLVFKGALQQNRVILNKNPENTGSLLIMVKPY